MAAPVFKFGQPCEATLYQCTACAYTSPHRHCVATHIERVGKCRHATVVSAKCVLHAHPPGAVINSITGDRNTQTINNINHQSINQNIQIIIPVGSEAERDRVFNVFKDKDAMTALAAAEPEDIPAVILRWSKGPDAPPEMRNIRVEGNRVLERRANGQEIPVARDRFIKRHIADSIDACFNVAPAESAKPEVVQTIREDLSKKDLTLGSRDTVDRRTAAVMYATSDPGWYKLGAEGKSFVRKTADSVSRELDLL